MSQQRQCDIIADHYMTKHMTKDAAAAIVERYRVTNSIRQAAEAAGVNYERARWHIRQARKRGELPPPQIASPLPALTAVDWDNILEMASEHFRAQLRPYTEAVCMACDPRLALVLGYDPLPRAMSALMQAFNRMLEKQAQVRRRMRPRRTTCQPERHGERWRVRLPLNCPEQGHVGHTRNGRYIDSWATRAEARAVAERVTPGVAKALAEHRRRGATVIPLPCPEETSRTRACAKKAA